MEQKKTVRVGLKLNANFLVELMGGNIEAVETNHKRFASIVVLTPRQFYILKKLIADHSDGDLERVLRKVDTESVLGDVDYQCHFLTISYQELNRYYKEKQNGKNI